MLVSFLAVRPCKGLPREVVESPPLEMFKNPIAVSPEAWVSGDHSGAG